MFLTTIRIENPSERPGMLQMAANAFAGWLSLAGNLLGLLTPYHMTMMMYRLGRGSARVFGMA